MRIPSQFNQDSLYRRDNRQRETNHVNRRLMRLVIGLALVIVVMRQAAKPAIYQTFFDPSAAASPSGLPGDALNGGKPNPTKGGGGSGGTTAATLASTQGENMTPVLIEPEDARVAVQLVAQLRPSDQRQWVVALSRWLTTRPVPQFDASGVPSTIESLTDWLDSSDQISETQRTEWLATLDTLARSIAEEDQVAKSSDTDAASRNDPRAVALLAALDSAAASRVVDGSVWRSGDFDALYRFIDQADAIPQAGVSRVGVLPLLQQPDVFRNRWVTVAGGVARTERVDAKENPFGIKEYYQLWIRPDDGADRPIVVIVPRIPQSVSDVGSNATMMEGPSVTITGKYLKRLAYQSGAGADLAPVIVGQVIKAPLSESEMAATAPNADAGEVSSWWPIALACLVGLGLSVLAMWRTSVAAKRAREIRNSHRSEPDAFLAGLNNQASSDLSSMSDSQTEASRSRESLE